MKPLEFAKHLLLGSSAGRLATRARDALALIHRALSEPESVGTLANDQLATRLACALPARVFVDVGAHLGSIIDEVYRNNSRVSVIAIEAIPEKAAALRRKFKRAQVHECAAGESNGEASFFIDTERTGYSSLAQNDGRRIDVTVHALDDIIDSRVDVIKIDVEGAELGVIRGARRLIARYRPVVMFESGPDSVLGFTKEAMWETFDEQDYLIVLPNRVAHEDWGLTQEGFIESHEYPRRATNYFAIPLERRQEIRACARTVLGLSPLVLSEPERLREGVAIVVPESAFSIPPARRREGNI